MPQRSRLENQNYDMKHATSRVANDTHFRKNKTVLLSTSIFALVNGKGGHHKTANSTLSMDKVPVKSDTRCLA
jgi:hypothetical protein